MAASEQPVDKYGLFLPYLKKFPFEEKNYDVDESIYYFPGEAKLPNTHQLVKRFLKQVRESRGYDVDCYPPTKLNSPFLPIALDEIRKEQAFERYYARVVQAAHLAIQKINANTGHSYKLVEIEKAVNTRCLVMLLTFTAKEDDDVAGAVPTFQSMVYVQFGKDPRVEEWRFKPFPAPIYDD